MSPVASAALKVALSGAAVTIVLVRTRRAGKSFGWLGLTRPRNVDTLAIVAAYFAWMLGTNAVMGWRGPWDFAPWLAAPLAASAMRVLAVCALGPAAEELVFRGVGYALLKERIGAILTVALTAAVWTLLHPFPLPVLGVIFVDGLLLGAARWRSGSVWVPIAMHIGYNLFAIW